MAENREYKKWGVSAYYWNLYRKKIEQIYGPITKAILDRSDLRKEHRVLDIGGGAGEPSLTIRNVTGAHVFYTDPAVPMARFAKTEASSRGLTGLDFCACSGDQLPFASGTFDRIVARLSVMFIPDTQLAVREMKRVLRRPGKVTVVVWDDPKKNPMHSVPVAAMKPFLPSEPQEPDAPGGFRFAEPGKLSKFFQTFDSVEENQIEFKITGISSLDEFWNVRSQMSESLRDKLDKLSNEQKDQAANAVKKAVEKFWGNDGLEFPASVWVITASLV